MWNMLLWLEPAAQHRCRKGKAFHAAGTSADRFQRAVANEFSNRVNSQHHHKTAVSLGATRAAVTPEKRSAEMPLGTHP